MKVILITLTGSAIAIFGLFSTYKFAELQNEKSYLESENAHLKKELRKANSSKDHRWCIKIQ